MTAAATPPTSRPPGDRATDLLLDLAAAMHAAAIPADMAEERLRRVAEALGIDAQFFTMQSFFATELRRGGAERVEIRRIPFDTHWNVTEARAIDDLARALADRKIDAAAARVELDRIVAAKSSFPRSLVALCWAAYGAVVAVRVGGRGLEALAGAAIGAVAGGIHLVASTRTTINLEKTFLGAFLGTVAAVLLAFVLPPFDYPRALFGGISLLVPAMVVTIGIHEIANEALESGTVRLVYGLVCFGLLGAGIAAAFSIGSLFGVRPPDVTAAKLPDLVVLAIVAAGGLALVVCLEGRARDIPWMVAAVVIAFGAQELTRHAVGERGAPVVAAFVLGAAAYFYARSGAGRVPFTMLVPGLLQLAPGFLGTKDVLSMLKVGGRAPGAGYFDVIVLAVQLGIGILIASLAFRRRGPGRQPKPAIATP
jgi:uncharacterized membrane protein YjjP (DUF1212 family)